MQDKNKVDVKKILTEIGKHLKVKGIRALAKRIEINESTLYTWIKRGKIADYWALKDAVPDLNMEWLKTGKGPMFLDNLTQHGVIESHEEKTLLVRNYRVLAKIDADTLKEIQTWLNDMEKYRPGFTGWFRIEFQNRFPEFDDWKNNMPKKTNGDDNKVANG